MAKPLTRGSRRWVRVVKGSSSGVLVMVSRGVLLIPRPTNVARALLLLRVWGPPGRPICVWEILDLFFDGGAGKWDGIDLTWLGIELLRSASMSDAFFCFLRGRGVDILASKGRQQWLKNWQDARSRKANVDLSGFTVFLGRR